MRSCLDQVKSYAVEAEVGHGFWVGAPRRSVASRRGGHLSQVRVQLRFHGGLEKHIQRCNIDAELIKNKNELNESEESNKRTVLSITERIFFSKMFINESRNLILNVKMEVELFL